MKKQLLFAAAMLASCAAAVAQPQAASAPQKLAQGANSLMAAVWSPDGSKIAATGANYTGLYVFNADGSEAKCLNQLPGVGYHMLWSADGTELVGRTNVYEGARVMHEVRAFSVANGADRLVVAKNHSMAAPARQGITIANVYDRMVAAPASVADEFEALNGFAGEVVINPALSPDGLRVVFQIPGKGLWLINADGTNLQQLGKGMQPAWAGNDAIVYVMLKDNGVRNTEGIMYALDLRSGRTSTLVDNSEFVTMHPAVSPDGKKVVFDNDLDGALYLINLK